VALATYEVMVVALTAEAVAEFPGTVRQSIDDPALVQERERAVDGRETDRFAPGGQLRMDLLRCGVVRFGGKRL